MQTLNWYVQRLRGMSASEVIWRVRSTMRDQLDRPRFALGLYPSVPRTLTETGAFDTGSSFRLGAWEKDSYAGQSMRADETLWHTRLRDRAEKLLNHHISFFSLEDCALGDSIDWNRDYESGKVAPNGFAGSIDYRDYRVTGDAKIVWELNRHHHLVVLARAYHATGD